FAVDDMLIAQKIAKPEALGLGFGLGTSMNRAVFGPQRLSRIAGHPEGFFVGHSLPQISRPPGGRGTGVQRRRTPLSNWKAAPARVNACLTGTMHDSGGGIVQPFAAFFPPYAHFGFGRILWPTRGLH